MQSPRVFFFFFLNSCCQLNVCLYTFILYIRLIFFFPATETSVRLSAVLFPQHAGTQSLNGPFVKLFEGITPQQSLRSGHLLPVDGCAVLERRHTVKVACVLCFSRATLPSHPPQKILPFLESWNSFCFTPKGIKEHLWRWVLRCPEAPACALCAPLSLVFLISALF